MPLSTGQSVARSVGIQETVTSQDETLDLPRGMVKSRGPIGGILTGRRKGERMDDPRVWFGCSVDFGGVSHRAR